MDGARCACPPTCYEYLVELACALCAGPSTTVRVRTPHARVLLPRSLRCGICGGGAVQGDTSLVRLPEPIPHPPASWPPAQAAPGTGGMTSANSPYKAILWFTRYVDGKPVQVVAEYHQEWVNGYVAAALENKTGRCRQARSAFV